MVYHRRVTDMPTPAVEATLSAAHAELAARFPGATIHRSPIYHHWEDEELGYSPLYECVSIKVEPAGYPTWCRSSRDGTAIEGIFSGYHDARHPRGAHALIFSADERAALRARGWRGGSTWQARWPAGDPAAIVAAFAVLATLAPRVLTPAALPAGAPWPWADLLFHVLLAEVVGVEGAGARRILLTRIDGTTHRVLVAEGSPWDALLQSWRAAPPRLVPFVA